ncbi:MAG: RDD family protein [Actinomycetota bacterium]
MTDNTPVEPDNTAAEGTGAELMPRLLARLIDSVILSFVMFVVIVPIVFVTILNTSGNMFGGFGIGEFFISLVWIAIVIGYFAYLESSRGQTVGKMVMKLKVQGSDGQNPTFETAVKRNAFNAVGIIPVIGTLASLAAVLYIAYTINESPSNTGWHDEFAGGTQVISAG